MRNAQSHRGRSAVTESHVAATIMAMGECLGQRNRAAIRVLETCVFPPRALL
jgi:hypothetical protein